MRRRGFMSVGLAILMLVFSLIAAAVITNIGSNLIKTSVEMGKGQEENFSRIAIISMKNMLDEIKANNYPDLQVGSSTTVPLSFKYSSDLYDFGETDFVVPFAATVTLQATLSNTEYVFDVLTKAATTTLDKEDPIEEGVILQYN